VNELIDPEGRHDLQSANVIVVRNDVGYSQLFQNGPGASDSVYKGTGW
jgi:hypothetical protein